MGDIRGRRKATVARSGPAATSSGPSECRPKQAVHLIARLAGREAIPQLKFHEADEQRIERTPSGEELLSNVRERVGGGDHPRESADLAANALRVTDGTRPLGDEFRRVHGRTKTAPVMPAAAWPGRLQMNV